MYYQGNLEPVAAVGNPPTQNSNGQGRRQGPPNWEDEIRDHTEDRETDPENLPLHAFILVLRFSF